MIDWTSPTWGQSGTNVHESETGSWLRGSHGEEQER
jgi:hypothetical protein